MFFYYCLAINFWSSPWFDFIKQNESNLLKEQLHCLVRDNQILKRAVAIQHERNSENEEKIREVQHLKHAICQYQEQVRALEVNRGDSGVC